MISSCNLLSESTSESIIEVQDVKGHTVLARDFKPPKVVLLDSMPKPQTIEVPQKTGDFYIKNENQKEHKIDLLPPEIIPAEFTYIMQAYTGSDGLVSNSVLNSTIDQMGNLWFVTWGGGAVRYDGNSFLNYTSNMGLANNNVRSILQDKNGNMWFGTVAGVGVSRYDGKSFTTFSEKQGLVNGFINCIYEDKKGNIWFGTRGGISRFDGKSFTNYTSLQGLSNDFINAIFEDKAGNLWFASNAGISRYDGKDFTSYNTLNGLVNDTVNSVLEDKDGNLWFGTDGGISRYDGHSFTNFTEKQGLSSDSITGIIEDKKGILWFGTSGGGVNYYDGISFSSLTTKQGLLSNKITSIVEDNIGNLWLNTLDSGVCRYDGNAFTNYGLEQGIKSTIRSIFEDNSGNLWLGTDADGVIHYDRNSFTYYSREQGLADNQVNGILQDKEGKLWIGTFNGGVSRFDGKVFTNFTKEQGLISNRIYGILENKKGNLWFCTDSGVCEYNGISFTSFTKEQGLPDDFVPCMLEDKEGILWFGTRSGLCRFDGQSFTTYSKEQGLASNFIYDIMQDKMGNLWLCLEVGLSRFDGKSFINYTTQQGLPDNTIWGVTHTKEQNILVKTNSGMAILTGYIQQAENSSSTSNRMIDLLAVNNFSNSKLKSYQPVFEVYNSKRGYPLQDHAWGQNDVYLDSKGIIWYSTWSKKTGLVRFDYSALHKSKNPPNVMIQAININNENIIWEDLIKNSRETQAENIGITTPSNITEEALIFGMPLTNESRSDLHRKFGDISFDDTSKFYYVPENLVLPYRHNTITFKYAAIEPNYPQNVLYQCKLEGYDNDWRPPSDATKISFEHLFEGTYEFKLKALSPFGIWSDPITYIFKVLPPWYRTWWAYLFYAISGMTFLYLIFRWRTATLRQRAQKFEDLYKATEKFVPKPFLRLLQKEHIEDVVLGDSVKKNITVLFNDIRSFTTLVESRSPEDAFAFINRYWEFMAPIIRKYGGYIDQYQGDAILAIFPHNPEDGVLGAIAMMNELAAFNVEQKRFNDIEISMGIGLSTGFAMLGVIGEKERHVAGLISDVANTAARIEGLNKIYGSHILFSGDTANAISSRKDLIFRKVDQVRLKGKTAATEIFEVIEWANKLQGIELDNYLKLFKTARKKYFEGKFEEGKADFQECLKYFPEDKVVDILLQRCCYFIENGKPDDWDGTFTMTSK